MPLPLLPELRLDVACGAALFGWGISPYFGVYGRRTSDGMATSRRRAGAATTAGTEFEPATADMAITEATRLGRVAAADTSAVVSVAADTSAVAVVGSTAVAAGFMVADTVTDSAP